MTEDLQKTEDFNDPDFERIENFESQIFQNLYKLEVMRKTLYKLLDELNKTQGFTNET